MRHTRNRARTARQRIPVMSRRDRRIRLAMAIVKRFGL